MQFCIKRQRVVLINSHNVCTCSAKEWLVYSGSMLYTKGRRVIGLEGVLHACRAERPGLVIESSLDFQENKWINLIQGGIGYNGFTLPYLDLLYLTMTYLTLPPTRPLQPDPSDPFPPTRSLRHVPSDLFPPPTHSLLRPVPSSDPFPPPTRSLL